MILDLFKFCLYHFGVNRTMPFLQQMNGLRRNEYAMKIVAGKTILIF